jgi:hypothetical protein
VGTYSTHDAPVVQLLVVGDYLLSLGSDRKLVAWKIGSYDEPEVRRGSSDRAADCDFKKDVHCYLSQSLHAMVQGPAVEHGWSVGCSVFAGAKKRRNFLKLTTIQWFRAVLACCMGVAFSP